MKRISPVSLRLQAQSHMIRDGGGGTLSVGATRTRAGGAGGRERRPEGPRGPCQLLPQRQEPAAGRGRGPKPAAWGGARSQSRRLLPAQGRRLRLREDATPLFTERPPMAACQPRRGRPEAGSLLPGASGSQTLGGSQLTQLGDRVFPQRPVRSESGWRGPVWGAGPFSCRSTVSGGATGPHGRARWSCCPSDPHPAQPCWDPGWLHPQTRRLCAVGAKGHGRTRPWQTRWEELIDPSA